MVAAAAWLIGTEQSGKFAALASRPPDNHVRYPRGNPSPLAFIQMPPLGTGRNRPLADPKQATISGTNLGPGSYLAVPNPYGPLLPPNGLSSPPCWGRFLWDTTSHQNSAFAAWAHYSARRALADRKR
jgi:hypothetical protein